VIVLLQELKVKSLMDVSLEDSRNLVKSVLDHSSFSVFGFVVNPLTNLRLVGLILFLTYVESNLISMKVLMLPLILDK